MLSFNFFYSYPVVPGIHSCILETEDLLCQTPSTKGLGRRVLWAWHGVEGGWAGHESDSRPGSAPCDPRSSLCCLLPQTTAEGTPRAPRRGGSHMLLRLMGWKLRLGSEGCCDPTSFPFPQSSTSALGASWKGPAGPKVEGGGRLPGEAARSVCLMGRAQGTGASSSQPESALCPPAVPRPAASWGPSQDLAVIIDLYEGQKRPAGWQGAQTLAVSQTASLKL
ncbi:uncharacterized protein LOC109118326 isoform X2 [Fukomys damarensis]|uniref:uncharacterized protein LOC109118326 isoform X2 n=1 Tax=Fukomys damarensis TaxID=885580 RepID=UPI0008FEF891|nr:uncharacterized protein LOC109118326 isoform X2 [Fukomys damarensis]